MQPIDALQEMLRILRPGGLLVCVEPNNLWNHMAFTSLTAAEPVEAIMHRFEFWLRYHRGKVATGQGDHTIGGYLPGFSSQSVSHTPRSRPLKMTAHARCCV